MEQTKDMELTPDTGAQENAPPHPDDPNQIASGSSQSLGGANSASQDGPGMTHGQESYPGPRGDGGTDQTAGETPAAGDTDPAGTAASDETGQAGALSATTQDPQKNKANAWNG